MPYWEAMHRQKIAPDQYKCQGCSKVFRLREVQCDHIVPCVDPVVGWQGLAVFAFRLFVGSEGLQVLCKDVCHHDKTLAENKVRKANGG
jgi:5-methylcytosine-specific restriction endonuclease McrA